MQQTQVPLGEVEAPLQVMEHSVLHPIHRQAELMDLSSWFWQKPSESISAWLLQLWDGGVVAIICLDQIWENWVPSQLILTFSSD